MNNNENYIKQLNRDIQYYRSYADTANPNNATLNGRVTTSYKKTIQRMENDRQLAILKERNISN